VSISINPGLIPACPSVDPISIFAVSVIVPVAERNVVSSPSSSIEALFEVI